MRHLIAAAAVGLALVGAAQAQQPAPVAAPPAGFVAPAEPKADESNAQRAVTQPGNNAPFWRAVRESGNQAGHSTLPAIESGTLIQSFTQYPGSKLATAGEAWRQVRNQWILPYGGALLLVTCLALAMFYWLKGPIGVHETATGRLIERFTYFERAAHWLNAIAFCILAVSGIIIAFGKFFILPIIGGALFGWLTYALKTVHNFVGPVFAVTLAVMFCVYLRDNWPKADDIKWLMKGGGFFTGAHVPSNRFNAGEKIVFWGGLFLGSIVVGSGLVLDKVLPGIEYTRSTMQVGHMVHAIAALFMTAMIMAHIYLGTVGMKGAYRAMRDGYVDESWAKEHHEYWHRDIHAGKIPAQRTPAADRPDLPAGQH